jgi:Transposase
MYPPMPVPPICGLKPLTALPSRQHGITEQTYYRWKAKYGGMDSGEAKKLKQLEDENGFGPTLYFSLIPGFYLIFEGVRQK